MRYIKVFEEFDKDINWDKSTGDKMVRRAQIKQGTSKELLPQIQYLMKNFDETKFSNLLKQLKQEAVQEFGPRDGNPYESYFKNISGPYKIELLNLFDMAFKKIDKNKKDIFSDTEEMYNFLNK